MTIQSRSAVGHRRLMVAGTCKRARKRRTKINGGKFASSQDLVTIIIITPLTVLVYSDNVISKSDREMSRRECDSTLLWGLPRLVLLRYTILAAARAACKNVGGARYMTRRYDDSIIMI